MGSLGWLDRRIRSDAFEPIEYAIGLAHDCLEHTAFDGVADEIEAHGAMYRIRYEGGWYNEQSFKGSLDMEDFSSEWISLLQGLGQESYLPNPPKTRALDETIEEDISTIIEKGRAACIREFCEGHARDEYQQQQREEIEKLASVFRAYFRRGYRKAAKRYKGMASHDVAHLFTLLADAFKRHKPEFEGQEITVNVNLRTQTVRIENVYAEEYN